MLQWIKEIPQEAMMKRILPFFVLALALVLTVSFTGCAQSVQIEDLSRTSYIEVRAFSNVDQTYTDYVITDAAVVDEVCATLQSLTLDKIKAGMIARAYHLTFFDHAHRRIDSISVVVGNYVDYDGDTYKITSDVDLQAYFAGVLAAQTPVQRD